MLDNQQLFQEIPRHISEWTEQDVSKWFKINNIQIDSDLKFSGKQFLSLTPTKIFKQLKLSHFLTRKISDWIQNEVQDFQEYVNECQKKQIYQKQQKQSSEESQSKSKEDQRKKQLKINRKVSEADAPKYKSESGIKKNFSEYQIYKSQGNQHVKFQIEQDYSTQFYKPMKYQISKNCGKKEKDNQKNNSEQPKLQKQPQINKKVHKSQLVLKQLMQNGENKSQLQTYKYLPQDSEYYNNGEESEFSNRVQQHIQLKPFDFYQKNVKLVSSHLILPNNVLVAYFNDTIFPINSTIKIGRSIKNNMIMQNQGVSRHHAQILVEQEQIFEQNNNEIKKIKRYFLRDVGSKFGTFVNIESERPKRVTENQSYCIGQTVLKIIKLKIYKNKQKFDMTLQYYHNNESEKVFLNKSQITIGNSSARVSRDYPEEVLAPSSKYQGLPNQQITKRSKQPKQKDLQLSYDQGLKLNHCRFVYINADVYFQQVEGTILQRLQPNVKMEFTRHKYQVKFGDGNVSFVFQNSMHTLHDQ